MTHTHKLRPNPNNFVMMITKNKIKKENSCKFFFVSLKRVHMYTWRSCESKIYERNFEFLCLLTEIMLFSTCMLITMFKIIFIHTYINFFLRCRAENHFFCFFFSFYYFLYFIHLHLQHQFNLSPSAHAIANAHFTCSYYYMYIHKVEKRKFLRRVSYYYRNKGKISCEVKQILFSFLSRQKNMILFSRYCRGTKAYIPILRRKIFISFHSLPLFAFICSIFLCENENFLFLILAVLMMHELQNN